MSGGEVLREAGHHLDAKAFLIVLIGPSGVGKSAIAKGLYQAGLVDVTPSLATRPRRRNEPESTRDHRFVTDEQFDEQKKRGDIVVTKELYGYRYGALYPKRPPADRIAAMVLKFDFMEEFVEYYPNTRIYQIEATEEVSLARMLPRGQPKADLLNRLQKHGPETEAGRLIAHHIFDNNGLLADTLRLVKAQILEDHALYDAANNNSQPVLADIGLLFGLEHT